MQIGQYSAAMPPVKIPTYHSIMKLGLFKVDTFEHVGCAAYVVAKWITYITICMIMACNISTLALSILSLIMCEENAMEIFTMYMHTKKKQQKRVM